MTTADVVVDAGDLLGESPIWSPDDATLLWLDLERRLLHRWDGARLTTSDVPVPGPLGGMVRTTTGRALLAHGARLDDLDLDTGAVEPLLQALTCLPDVRANDVKADTVGRVWLSTAHSAEADPRAVLLRMHDRTAVVADAGYVVANGPAFSADGERMFVADSAARTVWTYRLGDDGSAHDRSAFVRLDEQEGLPDGMTVDAEGGLWIALWDGGAVVRYDARGRRTHRIGVPAPRVTSLAFGGADLDLLFITSARSGLDDDALRTAPRSGALFVAVPGVVGLEETPAEMPRE